MTQLDTDLLPSVSTELERSIEKVCRLSDELWQAAGRVGDIKVDVPDEAVPFLVWEYGLEPVMPYIKDARRALREGRAWQRVRGTPESVRMALAWIDLVATIDHDATDIWWDLFQMSLDEVPNDIYEFMPNLLALTRLSKPAHMDIVRVHSGYDHRELVINGSGLINGPSMFNDWSGIWIDDQLDWPKLSFRSNDLRRIDFSVGADNRCGDHSLNTSSMLARTSGFVINRDLINGPETLNSKWATKNDTSLQTSALDLTKVSGGYPLIGGWPERPYGDPLIQFATVSAAPGAVNPS